MVLNSLFGSAPGLAVGDVDVLQALDCGGQCWARRHHVLNDTRDVEKADTSG